MTILWGDKIPTTKSDSDRLEEDETKVRLAEVEATVRLVEAMNDLMADMVSG